MNGSLKGNQPKTAGVCRARRAVKNRDFRWRCASQRADKHQFGDRSLEGARLQAAPYIVFKDLRQKSRALSKLRGRKVFPQALQRCDKPAPERV